MKSFIAVAAVAALFMPSTISAEDIAARVNGAPITEAQVKDISERMAEAPEGGASPDAARQQALDSLIDLEILTQAAKTEKIEVKREEVDEQLAGLKNRFGSEEAYRQALAANHATEDQMRSEVERSVLMQKLLDSKVSVKLAPDAADKFYKDNPDKFQHDAEVRASHILFTVAEGSDDAEPKKRAEETLKRVRAGEDFATLAKELSQDAGSAQDAGDLGFFSREMMVKPFADAAFNLKPGQISELVRTQFGFHIIKVTETRPPGLVPLDDVKEQVRSYLEQQERDRQERAFVEQLKKQAKIEVVQPAK